MDYRSVEDLLTLLEGRGLRIGDRALATHYLSTIGHYRLTDFYPFFYSGTKSFDAALPAALDDVFHLYSFDRRLRLLLLGPLEKIEVALRALLIKEIGDFTSSGGGSTRINLFDSSLYDLRSSQNQRNFDLARYGCEKGAKANWIGPYLKTRAGRGATPAQRDAEFARYYRSLPCWSILETASFGPLVHIFATLRPEIAYKISEKFALPRVVLTTVFYSLKELRNSCAHHEPIWDWDAKTRSVLLSFPKAHASAAGIVPANDHRLYAYCAIIHILLSYLSNGKSTWHRRLKKLVNEYNTLYSTRMGFPEDWQTMPFWCVSDIKTTDAYQRLRVRIATP